MGEKLFAAEVGLSTGVRAGLLAIRAPLRTEPTRTLQWKCANRLTRGKKKAKMYLFNKENDKNSNAQ